MIKIPKALEIIKSQSGYNWIKIRKFLIKFMNAKREICFADFYDVNTQFKLKKYLQKLVFEDFRAKTPAEFVDCEMSCADLVSHLNNVLVTLNKIPYDSALMAYIQYSHNTCKSGNKKYPQFN